MNHIQNMLVTLEGIRIMKHQKILKYEMLKIDLFKISYLKCLFLYLQQIRTNFRRARDVLLSVVGEFISRASTRLTELSKKTNDK